MSAGSNARRVAVGSAGAARVVILYRLLGLVLALVLALGSAAHAQGAPLRVWHAYRGAEEKALTNLAERARAVGHPVELLSVPFGAYASKLESGIKLGHGPDVFLDAHERLGSYLAQGLLAQLPVPLAQKLLSDVAKEDLDVVSAPDGAVYGVPIAHKTVALYVNDALLQRAPASFEELLAVRPGNARYGVVYESGSAYFHAGLLHAFGGRFLRREGDAEQPFTGQYGANDEAFGFVGAAAARSVEFVHAAQKRGDLPEEAAGALVTQLFVSGKAAAVLSGPWLAADLPAGLRYHVEAPPPIAAAGGAPVLPLMTVEAAFVTPAGREHRSTAAFLELLVSVDGARERASVGRQVVAQGNAWREPELASDGFLAGFRAVAQRAVRTPRSPAMRAVWQPAERALLRVLRGDGLAKDALEQAEREFRRAMRPPPPATSPWPLALLGALSFGAALWYLQRRKQAVPELSASRSLFAWGYVAPATLATFVLVALPLLAGAATSLFVGTQENPVYVGLANYADILSAAGTGVFESGSFWLTLIVTVVWTVVNVILHVSLGLVLGVLLSRPLGKIRSVYRTLLILPWAIPSYVTALAWKGMFHRQLGAINALLGVFGAEPISFFSRFSTAFAANVATNAWLGFPFMMVVVLGAITSLPKEVLEAADVDGATRWQRFRLVTLPLLKPTLLPAVVLGSVWTFNAFNVVFLVSGGEPGGQTDILISEAYRWAFTREAHYGYAAAYAVLIFLLLASSTRLLDRLLAPKNA